MHGKVLATLRWTRALHHLCSFHRRRPGEEQHDSHDDKITGKNPRWRNSRINTMKGTWKLYIYIRIHIQYTYQNIHLKMIKNTSNNQLFFKYGCVWKLDTHIPHLYCPFRKKSRGQFRIQFVLIYHHLPMCFFCGEMHLFQRTSGISNGIPKRTACRCPAPQPLLTVVMPTSWLDPRSGLSCEGLKPPMNLGVFS